MRFHVAWALAGALVVVAGCESASTATLETDEQKASYAIGRDVGGSLKPAGERLDLDAFMQGIRDVLADKEPAIAEAEVTAALEKFSQAVQEDAQRVQAEAGEKNRTEGQAYMTENAKREGVQTTASGLQYEVLTPGAGPTPTEADRVTIHYKGTLVDGTQFDSSYDRGEPATFGVTGVIPGFSEGLRLMTVGSKYRFVIPGELAYGPAGSQGVIGPDATLIFEVELLEIPSADPRRPAGTPNAPPPLGRRFPGGGALFPLRALAGLCAVAVVVRILLEGKYLRPSALHGSGEVWRRAYVSGWRAAPGWPCPGSCSRWRGAWTRSSSSTARSCSTECPPQPRASWATRTPRST